MGIQGLLSLLRTDDTATTAIEEAHISKFRGKQAAVDAYSWLHKSVFSCAHDLFLGKQTNKYVDYCIRQMKMLLDNGVRPILVFDGGRMPFKIVEQKRKADREKARKDANNLIAMGQMNLAFNQIVQSIDITHEMASNVMKAAREIGVESIVSPYEADPQLVYLEQQGIVDLVISEDSDLIVFGAKLVFLKLSSNGDGELYNSSKLEACLQSNRNIRCTKFTFEKLRHAAILSGCDYLKNIPGVGLKKAWKFMNMTENTNVRQFLKKIPSYLKISAIIDDEFIDNFIQADLAFKHQLVFDPRQKNRVPLNPVEEITAEYQNFLGKFIPCTLDHFQLALGNIDSRGNEYDSYHPSENSYLYHGTKTGDAKSANETSPIIGFNTSGVYKRKSGRNVFVESKRDDEIKDNDEEDIFSYYRNLGKTSASTTEKEIVKEVITPPKPRIRKCKFFKNRDNIEQCETVRSRYFKVSTDEELNEEPQHCGSQKENDLEPAPEQIGASDNGINDNAEACEDVDMTIIPDYVEEAMSSGESPNKKDSLVEYSIVKPDSVRKRRDILGATENRVLKRRASHPKLIRKNSKQSSDDGNKKQTSILGFFKRL